MATSRAGAQGATVKNVIAAMDSTSVLTTQKSFYVTISRAKESAEIFTDDAGQLRAVISKATGQHVSALDAISEAAIQRALAALDCTVITIAHRLSTVRDADLIVVMDAGRVVLVGGETTTVGTPVVEGASVRAKILEHARDKKKITFRYRNKSRYRVKKGHRQPITRIQIDSISV